MCEDDEKVEDLPLTKQGNSLCISIPKKVLKAAGLEYGDWVRVILKKRPKPPGE